MNIPSTVIIKSTDPIDYPNDMALVVMKHIFSYQKSIKLRGDKIFISLPYYPKKETIERNFGNLPVQYLRTRFKNEKECDLFGKALTKFAFNFASIEAAS